MDQSLSPISDSRIENAEASRRLYRSMMEVTRQLDDLRSYAKTTKDLFTVQAHSLRTKLREYAERLIFSHTLNSNHKIEDILWRKGFYEDVSTSKRLRKDNQWLPEERAQLILHLKCGLGFYHHLLLCLQAIFGITSSCIDFSLILPDQDYAKSKVQESPKKLEIARESVHRCLVCLGDLSRYLMDIPPCWDDHLAYRYYHQALSWNPENGKPHNQLGTLSSSTNCNLDAIYHFMRCLVTSQPFEGAEGNLKRSFERSALQIPQEKAASAGPASWCCYCPEPGLGQLSESQDYVRQFLSHFLLLAEVWFFDRRPVGNISYLCHQTLLDFRCCLGLMELVDEANNPTLSFQLSRPRENFPSKLSKDMILKIIVITLICLHKLKSKGSDQSSSAIAFLLALLCLLVQQVREHFKDSVLNLSGAIDSEEDSKDSVLRSNGDARETEDNNLPNGIKKSNENGHEDIHHSSKILNGSPEDGGKEKKIKKRKKIVRRRHRQCNSSDDSDQSMDEDSNVLSGSSDTSDDEEVVLDLSSDDDEVPGNTEFLNEKGDKDADVVILEDLNETANTSQLKNIGNSFNLSNFSRRVTTRQDANPVDVLEQVTGEDLLPAIKICCDWLQGDKSTIEAVGKDSSDMLKGFVELVNTINIDLDALDKDPASKLFLKHRTLIELGCKVPLPEDAQLQNLPLLRKAQSDLDWEIINQNHLTSKEEALLRIFKLVHFCHFLETIPDSGVEYNQNTRLFSICANNKSEKDAISKSNQSSGPSVDLQRREEVMHNMGQLWLRAEVQNLETSVKRGSKGATFSPYLVLDADALMKYCHLVGQLMASRKFIMIVPSVVLTALDQLKRESVQARDAIRWLEFQFQKGSRFLRAQTTSEVLHLPLVSYPKQKSRNAWAYFKVLECCHYLNQHSTLSRSKESDGRLVTLLTGHNWTDDDNDFSPIGVATAVGIAIEHIESFFTKWKTSSKSHG